MWREHRMAKFMRVKLKKNKWRRKKTKTNRRHNNNPADNPALSICVDDDMVVCQILSRLPVKSLMRFKCVCKRWKSIIEEDPSFINLHLGHSEARPSLFIHHEDKPRVFELFLLRFGGGRDANIYTFGKLQSSSYLTILGPVGGLICLVGIFDVRIYNVSTREVTPWINSAVSVNVEKGNGIKEFPECYFGFDPTTKKHKVLFVWCSGKFQDLPVCEVLTVGEDSWRVIDELPPPDLYDAKAAVSANGSIYWHLVRWPDSVYAMDYEDEEKYSTEWIIAFDIGSEKFRMIPAPKSESSSYHPTFTVVDGCLAIVRRMEQNLKIWIFLDHNKENGTFVTICENDWTRLTIELPYDKMLHWSVILVHSVPGKDQIILETYEYPDTNCFGRSNIIRADFYYYDRKKKTLKKLEINGDSSFLGYIRAKCSIFVENLLPVQKKLCSSSSVPSLNAGKQSQESERSKLSTSL